MRLVHVADLHLGYQQFGLDERFADFTRAFREAIDRALDLPADAVLIAGDLFNKRELNARTLLAAMDALGRLRDAGIPAIAVEGNHDKAFRAEGISWMEFLNQRGWLVLLRPAQQEGRLTLLPWDPATRSGARYRIGDVEFCGLGYLGALAPRWLEQVADGLDADGRPRVALLHAGIGEGPEIGRLRREDVAVLQDRVSYLALGHIHHRYEHDGWAFNPGAPEHWDLGEIGQPKGRYIVTIEGDVRATHEASSPRPACRADVDISGAATPQEAMDRIIADTAGRVPAPAALLHLAVHGDAPFRATDLDLGAACERLYERDGWLFIESKNQVNQRPWSLSGDVWKERRETIERLVLAELVAQDAELAALGDRAVDAILHLKELAQEGADGSSMAEFARALAGGVAADAAGGLPSCMAEG